MKHFLFILINTFYSLQTLSLTCENYQIPLEYTETKEMTEKKIKDFSNLKAIAQQADKTLSKLIMAKSPVITSWMNNRGTFIKI